MRYCKKKLSITDLL